MLHSRLLKYLDEVSRLGSIRKAASRLNVASSAINRQILALENDLGPPIFERMPRRLRLTSTGEILIAHVRETLKGHQRVEAQIEALKGLARGEVTIATMNGLAAGPLPRFLNSILDRHPRIGVSSVGRRAKSETVRFNIVARCGLRHDNAGAGSTAFTCKNRASAKIRFASGK